MAIYVTGLLPAKSNTVFDRLGASLEAGDASSAAVSFYWIYISVWQILYTNETDRDVCTQK